REAAAQWARALRFAGGLSTAARAELLSGLSNECYLTEEFDEAIAARNEVVDCYRQIGDRLGEGDSLRNLSRLLWHGPGRIPAAEEAGESAVRLLEQLPPSRELAMAYANLSQLRLNQD